MVRRGEQPVPPAGTPKTSTLDHADDFAGPAVPKVEGAFVNSDACLEPQAEAVKYANTEEEEDLRRALEFKPGEAVAGVVMTTAFTPPRALSLHRRRGGSYFFKLTLLDQKVWAQSRNPCDAPEGCMSPVARRWKRIAELVRTRKIFVRDVDARTAMLFVGTWKALLGRAQVVEEIGVFIARLDGVGYRFWQGERAGRSNSPRQGSVLGRAVLALEWLEYMVETPVAGDAEDMALFRHELRDVLARTKNREPCLRPYEED